MADIFTFWKASNLNKGLVIVGLIVLALAVQSLMSETYMMWHFPEAKNLDYRKMKVKNKKDIYIDHYDLPAYAPQNPFSRLPLQEENYGVGPFSMTPRYGITPNFCCLGKNGKACYADDCRECQACFEQDEPLDGSIKTKPSQQIYSV